MTKLGRVIALFPQKKERETYDSPGGTPFVQRSG